MLPDWLITLFLGINIATAILLSPYAFNFLYLWWKSRRWADPPLPHPFDPVTAPRVTVQIPVYNEPLVVARVIDAVCSLDYPQEKLDIQVLDDSTDETSDIARKRVEHHHQRGIDITFIHRDHRTGYKAGALKHGLKTAKGEFAAIFDADFVPPVDFLQRTIPYFDAEPKVGAVQGRWTHLNRHSSRYTRSIALGLDAHFLVEQSGRRKGGYYLTFNGTAGIWRIACIEDAGGWQHDTVVEDLDLAYRAQRKGWSIIFLKDVTVPQEIPPTLPDIRVQQVRWGIGGTQCFRKHIRTVMTDKNMTRRMKLQSLMQLSVYWIYPMLVLNISTASILILIGGSWPSSLLFVSIYISSGFAAVGAWSTYLLTLPRAQLRLRNELPYIPLLGIIGFGLSLSMTAAVLKGLFRKGGKFERTPKHRLVDGDGGSKTKAAAKGRFKRRRVLPEILLALLVGAATVKLLFGLSIESSPAVGYFSIFLLGLIIYIWEHLKPMPEQRIPAA
jgi:cellulose synthase/poly-beta-1,6-N-acetylglucosamine synthase-like glycosyltransferase